MSDNTFKTTVVFHAHDQQQAKQAKDSLELIVAQLGTDGLIKLARLLPEMQGMMNEFGEQGIRDLYKFSKKPINKIFLTQFKKK